MKHLKKQHLHLILVVNGKACAVTCKCILHVQIITRVIVLHLLSTAWQSSSLASLLIF